MRGPDGTEYPNVITYLEVTEPLRIVVDHGDDKNPKMFHVVTEFLEVSGGTQLVSTFTFPDKGARDLTAKHGIPGHESTMRRLEALLTIHTN